MASRIVWKILQAYANYEYFPLIIYGELRAGKSVVCIKHLAQIEAILAHKEWKENIAKMTWDEWQEWVDMNIMPELRDYSHVSPYWSAWKRLMVFLPEQYMEHVDAAQRTEKQQAMLAWDDAGVGASQYRWADELGTTLSEYVNVGATDFAGQELTVPSPKWILKHFRDIPGVYTGQVIKTNSTGSRLLRVYKGWQMPDMQHSGVKVAMQDKFNKWLPDPVFAEYDAQRRIYAKIVKERLRFVIQQMLETGKEKAAEKFKAELKDAGFDMDSKDEESAKPGAASVPNGTPIVPMADAVDIVKGIAYLGRKATKLGRGSPEEEKLRREVKQFLNSKMRVDLDEAGRTVGLARPQIDSLKKMIDELRVFAERES
jgi:hypothetical protein